MKPSLKAFRQKISLVGVAGAALVVAGANQAHLAAGPSALHILRQTTPGRDFIVETRRAIKSAEVQGQSQIFRGEAGELLSVRASIAPPNPSVARPDLSRLILHFRTSRNGPSIRSVELLAGTQPVFRPNVLRLAGDFSTAERQDNAWAISPPETMLGALILRIKAQFPIGFDTAIDPGELVIVGAVTEFPRLPEPLLKQRSGIAVQPLHP
jgi:hypothetical protein